MFNPNLNHLNIKKYAFIDLAEVLKENMRNVWLIAGIDIFPRDFISSFLISNLEILLVLKIFQAHFS